MPITLVLGGARSGKSSWAQTQAEGRCGGDDRLVMIATAQAFDAEMSERIAKHQADRDDRWTTVETPLALPAAISALRAPDLVVVDCLTLWLSNLMMAEADLEEAFAALEAALRSSPARVWLVSNEVGQGIVPEHALGRRFRDEAGRLHQRLATLADEALLLVAGLPLWLKQTPRSGFSS